MDALSAFGTVMRIGSGHASKLSAFGLMLMVGLPLAVKTTVEKWNKASISEFPAINAWVSLRMYYKCFCHMYQLKDYRDHDFPNTEFSYFLTIDTRQ